MSKENRSSNYVWIIMMVLPLMLLAWNLLVLSFSRDTTPDCVIVTNLGHLKMHQSVH